MYARAGQNNNRRPRCRLCRRSDTDATASRERSTSRHPGREPSLTSTFRSPPRQLSVRSLADETVTVVEKTVTATVQVAGIHARNSGVTLARRPAARPCNSATTRCGSLLRCEETRTALDRHERGQASWLVCPNRYCPLLSRSLAVVVVERGTTPDRGRWDADVSFRTQDGTDRALTVTLFMLCTRLRYVTLLLKSDKHHIIPMFSPVLLSGLRPKLVRALSARTLILVGSLPLSCHVSSNADCVPFSCAHRVRRLVLLFFGT